MQWTVCNFGRGGQQRGVLWRRTKVKSWPERLGHCGHDTLRDSLPHIAGVNKNEDGSMTGAVCGACVLGRATCSPGKQKPNKLSSMCTTKSIARVRTTVVGPIKAMSLGRAKYFIAARYEHRGLSIACLFHKRSRLVDALIERISVKIDSILT